MSVPHVKEFFNNLVTIELEDGHRFEGLLSRVDYQTKEIQLVDVEDLGNENDKTSIPHNKKLVSRTFDSSIIAEILFKEKHFSETKKYKKGDFWDPISEEAPSQQKPKYREKPSEKKERKYDKPQYRDKERNYEEKPKK